MSRLDVAKGQIAYLKFWLGVSVVINISLVGWLLSSVNVAPWHRILGALLGVIAITYAGWSLHRQIESRIDALEDM